jgi:hypothetical protein
MAVNATDNVTGGKIGEWIDDDIAIEMTPIYGPTISETRSRNRANETCW